VGVVLWLALGVGARAAHARELTVQVPAGWNSSEQQGALTLVPGDLPSGKFYTVVVPDLEAKLGSLPAILDAAKQMLSATGDYKALHEPKSFRSENGWDCLLVIGTVSKDGATLFTQAMALKKGEAEAIVLVVADSTETLDRYAEAYRGMFGAAAAEPPTPAPAPPPGADGGVDLRFRVPAGWVRKPLSTGVLLEKSKDEMYDKYNFRILVLPSQPLEGNLHAAFTAIWAANMVPSFKTSIVPLPLVRRLPSGAALAFDADASAETKDGGRVTAALYVLAQGKRVVPVVGIYYGFEKAFEGELASLFDSAEIPGAGKDRVPLFARGDLVGSWDTSSVSLANYVTSSGAYAGDASIATGSTLILGADGTFQSSFIGISSTMKVREKDAGKWSVDDTDLLLKGKEARRYHVFGVGADPKVGSFLVLSTYANTESQLSLINPRGPFQSEWYKLKQ